jgi:hypothetical protein
VREVHFNDDASHRVGVSAKRFDLMIGQAIGIPAQQLATASDQSRIQCRARCVGVVGHGHGVLTTRNSCVVSTNALYAISSKPIAGVFLDP